MAKNFVSGSVGEKLQRFEVGRKNPKKVPKKVPKNVPKNVPQTRRKPYTLFS